MEQLLRAESQLFTEVVAREVMGELLSADDYVEWRYSLGPYAQSRLKCIEAMGFKRGRRGSADTP